MTATEQARAAALLEAAELAESDESLNGRGIAALLRQRAAEAPRGDEWVVESTDARGEEALFWRAKRMGYTTDLNRAGRYSREEAESIARQGDAERAHRLVDVLPLARPTIDRDTLRRYQPPDSGGCGVTTAGPADPARGLGQPAPAPSRPAPGEERLCICGDLASEHGPNALEKMTRPIAMLDPRCRRRGCRCERFRPRAPRTLGEGAP